MSDQVPQFVAAFAKSLKDATFVKATLGNYKGPDEHLQRVNLRLIETKKGQRLYFLYHYETRDTAKNYDFAEGLRLVEKLLSEGFASGHLFTTEHDYQLSIGRKGRSRLNIAKPTVRSRPAAEHNREKATLIDASAFYLKALGITDDSGRVRDKQQDKWRQINKFVEILASLVDKSALKDRAALNIVDMGSGKGYLTFAAYDYFSSTRGLAVTMTGVDTRDNLISLCSDIAKACEFDSLRFVRGSIDSYELDSTDILIALHACNTATDDALHKGITAKAELIVAAPCCHQEIRPQIKPPAYLKDVLRHGVLLERTAETLTDGLRSLLLERSGYGVKMLEFVPVEHTPKNNMLVATHLLKPKDPDTIAAQIADLKTTFGIEHQRLEELLT